MLCISRDLSVVYVRKGCVFVVMCDSDTGDGVITLATWQGELEFVYSHDPLLVVASLEQQLGSRGLNQRLDGNADF